MSKSIETQAKTIEAAIEEALRQLGASYDEVDVDILQEAGFLKKAKVRVTLKETKDSLSRGEKDSPSKSEKETTTSPSKSEKETTTSPSKSEKETKDSPSRGEGVAARAGEPARVADGVVEMKKQKREKETKSIQTNQQAKKDSSPPRVSAALNDMPPKLQAALAFTKKLLELLENPAEITYEITEKSFNINVNGNGVGQIIGKGGEVMNAIQTLISSIAIANSAGENKRVYLNVEDYKERRAETLKALALRKAEKVKETGRYIKLEPMNARDRAIIHNALQGIEGIRTYSTGTDPHRCLCIKPIKNDQE